MELVLLPLLLCFKPSFPPLNRSVNMKHDRHFFFPFSFCHQRNFMLPILFQFTLQRHGRWESNFERDWIKFKSLENGFSLLAVWSI